jgi:hypothetical protein
MIRLVLRPSESVTSIRIICVPGGTVTSFASMPFGVI